MAGLLRFLLQSQNLMKRLFFRTSLLLSLLILFAKPLATEARAQIPPPRFTKRSLLNGMEVFFLPGGARRSHFVLMVKNGAAFDPVGRWGATYLMTRMILERTQRRTGQQIRQDLEAIGAKLRFQVGWDAVFFYGSAPGDRIQDALNILSEVVVRPRFEKEIFEEVRQALVEEVENELLETENRTQRLFLRQVFQHNPYAHSVKGDPETLKSLQLNDIRIQYRKLFMPNQAQLALYQSGDLDRLFRSMGREWGSWVRREPVPFTFRQAERPVRTQVVVFDHASREALLRAGNLAVKKGSREFYALKILEQYLTLLLPEWAKDVAAQKQIQASFRLEARKMPGFFQFSIQAPAPQLIAYLRRFREVMRRLQQDGIDPARYREAKELAFLDFKNSLESPPSRLFELLKANLYDLGISYIANYGILIDRVRLPVFQAVLRKFFQPDSSLIVVAGSASELATQLEAFGEVEVLK
ncbi:MAG: M16 family metallopeptidase [Acidobacteriota bacterium]